MQKSFLNNKYFIKKIENLNDFENLKFIWDNMAEKHGSYFPFLCFDWFKIWLKHFLKDNKLLILSLCKEDEILTIVPFILKKEKFKGINVKKIELIGNVYSPVRYFLFRDLDKKEKEENLSNILAYFLNIYKEWDIIDFCSIPEENNNFDILKIAVKRNSFKYLEYFCFGNWYLDNICFNGDQYIKSRTSNIKNNIKRYRRKLQEIGKLEFILVTNDNNNRMIDHFMDSYYIVYKNSWKRSEMDPTFHRDLAKNVCDKGWLRLGFLFLDGKPIASQLWIVCQERAYIVKLAYDENYKKFIPGVILSSEMMKYVIDVDKVKEIDYLIGDEPYKKDWTPKRRERKGLIIFNNNFRGYCVSFLMLKIRSIIQKNKHLKQLKIKLIKIFK